MNDRWARHTVVLHPTLPNDTPRLLPRLTFVVRSARLLLPRVALDHAVVAENREPHLSRRLLLCLLTRRGLIGVRPHRLHMGIVLVDAPFRLQASDTLPLNPLAFYPDGG